MSEKTVSVTCPDCGETGDFTIWTSIDLVENPPMEEKIRSGSLFRYSCPQCGIITKIAYPTLIHDAGKKQMIYLASNEETYQSTLEMYSKGGSSAAEGLLDGEHTVRLFRSVPDLMEYFRIRKAELDDRVVELLRLFVYHELKENNPDLLADQLYFEQSEEGEDPFVFELMRKDEIIGRIGFKEEAYENMKSMFQDTIERLSEGRIVFDADWASQVFAQQDPDATE